MPAKNVTEVESRKSSDDNPGEPVPVINHPSFFFDDRLIVIQIENVRFNVHRYQLSKSQKFTDLFAAAEKAEAEGKPFEGSSIDNPIKLEGMSASDFERLLTVLYATHFSANHPEPNASLIIPAFRLANMLKFSELRTYLIPLAEKELSDVDKIVFAREFDVKDWLAPAYVNLCQRSTTLTTDEARKLGINSLLMISLIREEFPPTSTTSGQSCSGATVYCSSYCSTNHTSSSHCAGCTASHRPAPTGNPQTIQQRLKEWIQNDCEFK